MHPGRRRRRQVGGRAVHGPVRPLVRGDEPQQGAVAQRRGQTGRQECRPQQAPRREVRAPAWFPAAGRVPGETRDREAPPRPPEGLRGWAPGLSLGLSAPHSSPAPSAPLLFLVPSPHRISRCGSSPESLTSPLALSSSFPP